MKTPREKYENDPHYNALVDSMTSMINQGNFTPSELREAAIYAATRYEMMSVKPLQLDDGPQAYCIRSGSDTICKDCCIVGYRET